MPYLANLLESQKDIVQILQKQVTDGSNICSVIVKFAVLCFKALFVKEDVIFMKFLTGFAKTELGMILESNILAIWEPMNTVASRNAVLGTRFPSLISNESLLTYAVAIVCGKILRLNL
jgi:hypothetical protein